MADQILASTQTVLENFHLKPEDISKFTAIYDDLDSLAQLIRRGQNNITLHCKEREELDQTNQNDVLTMYDAELSKLDNEYNNRSEKDKYLTNDRYILYREHIWNVKHADIDMPPLTEENNNDDEEIVMGPTKLSFKCPITTSWLEQPMTSRVCKHSFTKSAITQLIRINHGAVTCPVSGCNKYIRMDILYDDELLADKVKRAKEKAEEESFPTEFYDIE
ncbi:hypothetical protein BCV72DRAFT_250781 [Rhizopus microsporus var. microsporus]|uniref:SP-RING-type domain-containing protein n=1 Tax=Rhizopus microsporus var. microsporus TaxID=86635 RepID=A0A1X0QZD6_RHIZD|nr:hypothetical protein BCV72DRAFT_250781 [Rhizopus microsporus var. microsporus]